MLNDRKILNGAAYGEEEQTSENVQDSIDIYNKSVGETKQEYNPFVKKDGSLVNPYINYQKVLDNPNVSSKAKDYISKATGLSPAKQNDSEGYAEYTNSGGNVSFNENLDSSTLNKLDVTTELPKLNTNQIKAIIEKHFSKSNVITPADAEGIFNAQQTSGMSALAILGIGALESGYGTSGIAKKTNNIWGYGATNNNPLGNAHRYSQMSQGALEFAKEYLGTYYGKYGAKSIYAAGTGNNPAGKGYAYFDNGQINPSWANYVGDIMGTFYNTAKAAYKGGTPTGNYKASGSSGKLTPGKRIADTATYNNGGAKGQCVWYVRGRAKEKLGINMTHRGNGNQQYTNAPSSAKVSASAANIRPNMIVSYKYGTSSAGQKYGHVIYIEDVVGDTVYYTEGGSGYYKNGTDGVVKTATREGILKGVNTNGKRMGSTCLGFVDVTKLK